VTGPRDPPEAGSSASGRHKKGRLSRLEAGIRRIDRFQQTHGIFGFPWAVMQKYGNDEAGSKAALLAYYGLFALFPLLLLFTTILGYVLHNNSALREQLVDSALGKFPIIGTQIRSQTEPLQGRGVAVVIGLVLLLYGALGVGRSAQSAMNAVWNIPYVHWPNVLFRHVRAIGVLALLVFSTIGSTVLTGFATLVAHGRIATVVLLFGSILLNFFLILAAFAVLTAQPIPWRDFVVGAALAAVFWQSLQTVGTWYIARGLQHESATYGFFAVVIVLLSWIYVAAQLFLLAAEVDVVRCYRLWPRSITQPPLTEADRKVFERLARMEIRRPEVDLAMHFSPEADRDPLRPTTKANGTDSRQNTKATPDTLHDSG
jgi:YihY family inner membrane protein